VNWRNGYKWLVVAMLWCVCFLNYADRQLIFTVFPLLQVEFHLNDVSLSILSASFMCTYAVFGPIAGLVCDRVSRRKLVLGTLVFLVAGGGSNCIRSPLLAACGRHRSGRLGRGVLLSLGFIDDRRLSRR
jgi:MFS family permease